MEARIRMLKQNCHHVDTVLMWKVVVEGLGDVVLPVAGLTGERGRFRANERG
jgi:hypothetical protein